MSLVIKTGEAKTRLSELIALVEAGEDVTIARGDIPVVRLVAVARHSDADAAVADILQARAALAPTSTEEILDWRDAGRR
ncbi:antitoxin (DNA-binding transcriptional repressor) of toxin-antitoxin stability system [Palleronia aestuarii]|uniref:Antitoxin (DNA-binding transcriptional repressor) of toxin-antitoxin stability system n=1 Tax=Palleronia aestuarii TaxID=568105 RepID=A0A2W7MV63_9RHOB|nr:type II toxin-antitoxin system prevent-host-death family antitoxin [Palleronia aestuarii]PZX11720.1 antitoxin (DNA-binding transcriptional repressor) of toxin-antitoxin stability system [Palleronia aestuarii]